MGRLAEVAGTKALTGPVSFTDARGITHHCEDEEAAGTLTAGKTVFHHRGAFFEQGCKVRGYTPEPVAPAAPKVGKTRRSSSDD